MENYELKTGRPENRCEDENAVYDLLDQLHIPYEYVDHSPASTMELCRQVDEILYPAVICKNLLLCNTQKTNFFLLLLREDTKFRTSKISAQLNSSRLSFAPEEYLLKYLHTPSGSASITGLLFDKEHAVHLAVDRRVLEEEWFGCHPCRNTTSLRMRTKDVFEILVPYLGYTYTIIDA